MNRIRLLLVMLIGVLTPTLAQTTKGDFYEGLTKKISYDKMIAPYGLEVTFNKTVHLIFPAAIKYTDLGSANIIVGKSDGAENVIRVKAAVLNFKTETNFP